MPLLAASVCLVMAARVRLAPAGAAPLLTAVGYGAALGALWLNRRHPWMLMIFIGLLLNAVVIVLNHGRMPLSAEALARVADFGGSALVSGADAYHAVAGPGTVFPLLGDVLPVGAAGRGAVMSPGDVLLAVGMAGFLQGGMRQRRTAEQG